MVSALDSRQCVSKSVMYLLEWRLSLGLVFATAGAFSDEASLLNQGEFSSVKGFTIQRDWV
jgi:hypothetical protein